MKSQRLEIEKLKRNLKTAWLGRKISYFEEITSTNVFAKALAEQGVEEGTLVIAETQTSGKGRLGRKWESPKGGIWLSIVLRPKLKVKELPKISLLASVAVAETVRDILGLQAEVKWPNDVLLKWRKICGILVESTSKGEKVNYVILGIGLNANFDLNDLSTTLKTKATTLKHVLGREINREEFIRVLLEKLEFYHEIFKKSEFKTLMDRWRVLSCVLNREVEITYEGGKINGVAKDIDENGWLIIKLKDGTTRKFFSADATIRVKL